MATEAEICKAIQSRQRIVYDCVGDHPPGEREGHPHIVFQTKKGYIMVHIWKTGGVQKNPGAELPDWRSYHLSDIVLLRTEGDFAPRTHSTFKPFNPQAAMYATTICSV